MDAQCTELHDKLHRLSEEMAENRSEHKSYRRRLDALEENGRRQNDILITLQRQADAIESMNAKIDKVADSVDAVAGRVREIEREPGERWKKLGFEIIKYIVLAAAGAAIGYWIK